MIIDDKKNLDYLYNYHDGKIEQGLKIGCILDNHLRFKRGSFVMVNGLDNVGKTRWILWYFLCLTTKHKLKWLIWSGENNAGQLIRDIIEMSEGEKLKEISKNKINRYYNRISQYFKFIDNSRQYNHRELLEIFKKSDADGFLVDPFTGLNHDRRINQFDRNYQFCNDVREFCNKYKKTIYVNTHPQTEAARRVYPQGHVLVGYTQIPKKSDTEGGQSFANRADDFITIHRMVNHPRLFYMTEIHVRKVKDTESGGSPTFYDMPMSFDFNNGLGFTIGGINALKTKI